MRKIALPFLLALSCAGPGRGLEITPSSPAMQAQAPRDLAAQARLAGDAGPAAAPAIAALRAAGPAGLAAVLAAYDGEQDAARRAPLRAAIDQVARQRDAHVSRLYWYTDLTAASAAARGAQRPILSLRMLGDLGDELSCANSRFFRTTLYANEAVAAMLRDRFILHWSSERPAPVITIDFRDGRKIQRTVTGNSIHYVLDAQGRPIDAIPGLYGPQAFLQVLGRAAELARVTAMLGGDVRTAALRRAHEGRMEALRVAWEEEVGPGRPLPAPLSAGPRPAALVAVPVAAAKAVVEQPMVRAVSLRAEQGAGPGSLERTFVALGDRHGDDARLDARSVALMREKGSLDWSSGAPVPLDDDAFADLVRRFERSMAEDTVRNEYMIHARILGWLAQAPDLSLRALNARVYGELFLTPKDDPWLGLVPPRSYTGLAGDGLIETGAPAR